jgi:hypothetical protein
MKMYKDKAVAEVAKDQLEDMKKAGWTRTKPTVDEDKSVENDEHNEPTTKTVKKRGLKKISK